MVYLLFVFFTLLFGPQLEAAEVYVDGSGGQKKIVLEGRIADGDFEKFLNIVLEQGIYAESVYLASNGGNVGEALKIGRFIRINSMATETGTRQDGKNICSTLIQPQNCNCASACALIFLGGIHRSGNMIGVHRPYLDHTVLKSLTLPESEEAGKLLAKETDKYLAEVGAPSSLKDIINANTSENIQMLEDGYINQNIAGYIKEVEEWLLAKCGSTKKLHSSNPEELKGALGNLACRKKAITDERRNFFAEKSSATIALVARKDKIPKMSILAFLFGQKPGLGHMIGQPLPEAFKMFALYGVGYQADRQGNMPAGSAFRVSDTFDIHVDGSGIVQEISFVLNDTADQTAYRGLYNITPPLAGKSALQELTNIYGKPLWAGCITTGGCYAWFQADRYEIECKYDRTKKTITSINFVPLGFFQRMLANTPSQPVESPPPQ